jgi:hypothetical protein
MNAQGPLVSRMSIFILSYYLVHIGLTWPVPHAHGANAILVGCVGLIAYVATDLTALLRNRELCESIAELRRLRHPA